MKVFLTIICISLVSLVYAQQDVMSLEGQWTVRLDSMEQGETNKWSAEKNPVGQPIKLPATLDEAGIGKRTTITPELKRPVADQLTRKYSYIGAVWYRRKVEIPETWKDKQIILTLERVIWKTEVWVDGTKCSGFGESLVAPHVFDLTSLMTPGAHTLTVCVDNRKQHDISLDKRNFAHAYTEGTQVIWNGMLGKIALQQFDAVYIRSAQVFSDYDSGQVRVELDIINTLNKPSKSRVDVSIPSLFAPTTKTVSLTGKNQRVSLSYKLDKGKIKTWDEFSASLYNVLINVQTKVNRKQIATSKQVPFGFRKLGNSNAKLSINNRRLFLRGTLECAIFPLTGHPPMDVASWERILQTAKSYGLNHLRFHSWCPPEAAFQAADKLGVYLQIELPLWSLTVGKEETVNKFLKDEAQRIIDNYGNHPSFVFWSMGNELEGDFDWLNNFMAQLKQQDNRRLYTTTTFTFQKDHGKWPESLDDFFITQHTKKGWVRGQSVFEKEVPDFTKDYSKSIDSISVPLIAHEIGQYSVYPNMDEIEKYTGILDPLNLKAIQQDLERKNMLKFAPAFTKATGKFAVQLYKEEIERALKTKGFSGFQLLDLHDFPGQGTAMVGVLDAFWDSKGFVTPEEFRSFCSPITLLIRYPKAVYTNDETFAASVEVANFGDRTLKDQVVSWTITSPQVGLVASGAFSAKSFPVGNGLQVGDIKADLSKIRSAEKLLIEVKMEKSKNNWNIWVYPNKPLEVASNVVVTRSYDEAQSQLKLGKKVLLVPELTNIKGITGKFVPVFWSPVHFPDQPGTMGILVNPDHKVFQSFPTDRYSSWQWWDINKNSVVVEEKEPIIRIIDNFFRNKELGILYEFKSGTGKLILCTADILSNKELRPVARHLYQSIISYMNSSDFDPVHELDDAFLSTIRK